jgi:hypothetical protein
MARTNADHLLNAVVPAMALSTAAGETVRLADPPQEVPPDSMPRRS